MIDDPIDLPEIDLSAAAWRRSGDFGENFFSHRTDLFWIGAERSVAGYAAAHEFAHFILHASTPYGLFLDCLATLQLNRVTYYCKEVLLNIEKKIRHPIYSFAKDFSAAKIPSDLNAEQMDQYRNLIQQHVHPWSHAAFLEQLLEGTTGRVVLEATEGLGIKSLEIVEDALHDLYQWDLDANGLENSHILPRPVLSSLTKIASRAELDKLRKEDLPVLPACPRCNSDGALSAFGAMALFEAHAFVAQNAHYEKDKWSDFVRPGGAFHYMSAYVMAVMKFGIDYVKSHDDFREVLFTLFALCDLSLFTPIGPFYYQLRPEHFTWSDIHPGHRFIDALDYATQNKISLKRLDDNGFRRFQDQICEGLNWPKPDLFSEIGSKLVGEQLSRHRDACRLRKIYPNLVPRDDAPAEQFDERMYEFFRAHMPLLCMIPPGGNSVQHRIHDGTAVKVVRHFIHAFSSEIMRKTEVDHLNCLPDGIDYEALMNSDGGCEKLLGILNEAIPFSRAEHLYRHSV